MVYNECNLEALFLINVLAEDDCKIRHFWGADKVSLVGVGRMV